MVHVETDTVRIPVARERVRRVADSVLRAERVHGAEVSITFVSEHRMARLNWRHLKHRGSTDVISFGFSPVAASRNVTGDIYISPAVARRNALAHGAGIREELLRLVIHGVLHVVGHEHPADDTRTTSAMWRRQELLLRRAMASA